MKTTEQIQELAERLAYAHFHCESGEVWEPFERFCNAEIDEWEETLADVLSFAMHWAQEPDTTTQLTNPDQP